MIRHVLALFALICVLGLCLSPAAMAVDDSFASDTTESGQATTSVGYFSPLNDGLWTSAIQWADYKWSSFFMIAPSCQAPPAGQYLWHKPAGTTDNRIAFGSWRATGTYCWTAVSAERWNNWRNYDLPRGGTTMRRALYQMCLVAIHERGHNWGLWANTGPDKHPDDLSLPMGRYALQNPDYYGWPNCQPWVDARMAQATP